MKRWAGCAVAFDKFKTYYKATSRTDNSRCLEKFSSAFRYWMDKGGYPQGFHSDTVNWVHAHVSTLCTKTRTMMISNGVPAASATQVINIFKRWFKDTYE